MKHDKNGKPYKGNLYKHNSSIRFVLKGRSNVEFETIEQCNDFAEAEQAKDVYIWIKEERTVMALTHEELIKH